MHLNIVFTMNNYVKNFLKDGHFDRILTMSIDDYVIGKGAKSNSFAISLERVKYKSLFLGIGGGGSSKFGIYWNGRIPKAIKIKLIKSFLYLN